MIYKYVAIGVLFASVCYVGGEIKRIYYKKYKYLDRLNAFLVRLSSEIETNKTPIIEILNSEIESGGAIVDTLNKYKDTITSRKESESVAPNNIFLTKIEKEKIEDFFRSLGSFDYDSELTFIRKTESEFGEMLKRAKEDKIKKGDLSFKLSVMLAFAVTLLLI